MQLTQISRYRITGELGKGSMGIVYEGRPIEGGPPVAIKVFYPDTQLPPEETANLLERFEREGSALAQLHHRNVVQVIEVGAEGEHEYIVMEKLRGFNLKELLALGTRFTLAEILDIMDQLLAGLTACHRAGVIHRDVKPANLVRAPDKVIKLTDFGIARVITDQTLSRAGTIVGTPNYMSPEQIRGAVVDQRTDIFSSGVLMYELLTGRKPFDGPDVTAIMYNVTNVQPPSPRFYNSALPPELNEVMQAALAKDPGYRYPTADEFARVLRDLAEDLRSREGGEMVLDAIPASPDADAADLGTGAPLAAPGTAQPGTAGALPSLMGPGSMTPGTVYCVDCGAANDAMHEFCVRCMRPLLKRDMVMQLAARQARMLHRLHRGDYVFLTCLSTIMAGVAILIIYLFFRGMF